MTTEKFSECLHRICNGDNHGITEIFTCYYKKMIYTALSKTKSFSDAEDVASNFIMYILENANELKDTVKIPSAWIYQCVRNKAIDFIRKNSKVDYITECAEDNFITEVDFDRNIIIQDCLSKLTDDEQELYLYRYIYGYKFKEISAMLNYVPIGTLKRKIHEMKFKLGELKKYL